MVHRLQGNLQTNPCSLTDIGPQCRVIASKNKDYAVGDMVISAEGWCTHLIVNSSTQSLAKLDVSIPADKPSTALGVLGMPGYITCSLVDFLF